MTLLNLFNKNNEIINWKKQWTKDSRQLLTGLSDTAKAVVMATAVDAVLARKIVIVTASQNDADKLAANLSSLLGSENTYHFIADDIAAAEFIFASKEKTQSRVQALNFLQDTNASGILITTIQACRLLLPNPDIYRTASINMTIEDEVDLDKTVKSLSSLGYKKVSQVIEEGEFSLRGDILDVFCLNTEKPYRLEFFGDEIDSIRTFDVVSQSSIDHKTSINIPPASDMIFQNSDYDRTVKILTTFRATCQDDKLISYIDELVANFKNYQEHSEQRKFLSLFYEKTWTLLDYLPKQTPIFLDDFSKIQNANTKFERDVNQYLTENRQQSKALSTQNYFADSYEDIKHYKPATFFSPFQRGLGNLKFDTLLQFNQSSMQDFFSQMTLFKDEMTHFEKSGYTVVIQADSEANLQRLQKTLQEYNLFLPYQEEIEEGKSQIILGQLTSGFNFMDGKIAFITEHELFGKKIKRKSHRRTISNAERLKDFNELEKGDYVVHRIHGIGRFLGLETIEISGIHCDYLTIQYQNNDRLSLPVNQIDYLSKYLASDDKEPKINKLNDGRFKKTKSRVQKQVEDIADDLIKLYAERSQLKGFAFSSDDDMQKEFEETFSYIETEDQLQSIKEVKQDMESPQPMDRLLVGDVGFGKTEVAMRAAFKAVNDHKQVAILVPTTVLAQQHYTNFLERFLIFPIEVDMLSRFKSKSQQIETLDKLKKGKIDIIIGTQRLLSKDVEFSDLGLIVIDEEHRFGVKHKEKLKELKTKADVLTLTATPIPRTLHMSMLGIRDLSIIETPPMDRYPVQTYVLEMNATIIREAILREIEREGQVFYLYNRVENMEQKVSELQELVPEATIGFVHGQMSEFDLENTLLAFIEGEYDVLVTTTIIETGVDIPNVNTLFVENADYMGLSTLYQLRGRVGRSNRIAYAYLMYRPDKTLTEVAIKRLDAVKNFTELGSGFKIAMRDLSIRGAGNILGASQSGFIDSVGFEMYSQLLEEAIAKKQGKTKPYQHSNAEINLKIDAYLPNDYIDDERQKIEIYKRIREIDNRDKYEQLQTELMDRFGDYPDVVAYLIEIGLLKSYMDSVFVDLVERKNDKVIIQFGGASKVLFLTQDYFEALSQVRLKARITENKNTIELIFDIKGRKNNDILENLIQFSETLCQIKSKKIE